MTTRTALTKARRGAAFLDAKLGRGWRRKIRRRDLDMQQGIYEGRGECGCILAQLYTNYEVGAEDLGITYALAERMGFLQDEKANWTSLTEAWLEVLREKA